MQKSRNDWLKSGDGNKKFFHTSILVRRRRNKIEALMNDQGEWVEERMKFKGLAVSFYANLFISDPSSSGTFIPGRFPQLTEDVRRSLEAE